MGLTDIEKEIILAYAECDMNTVRTGRKIYLHWNSIEWRLKRIHQKTGLDPKRFYDLVKLVEIAKD